MRVFHIIQDSQTKRFLFIELDLLGVYKTTLVLDARRATKWNTLDQAIDYVIGYDLPDNYVVLNFNTMHIEFSRQLPARLWGAADGSH